MERYLKFNIQSDQVCATPGNVYFKIRDKFSDGEYTEVFASEECFPLLLKVIQSEEDLSKSLNLIHMANISPKLSLIPRINTALSMNWI